MEAMDQLGTPQSWTCPDCVILIEKEKEARLRRAQAMFAMTSTTFDLPGHSIEASLGIARGVVVRSRSVLRTVGASIQTKVGGEITLFTKLCEDARKDAFQRMLVHAVELGADAVLGVRYDAAEIAAGVSEVLAYGTAVRIGRQKEQGPLPA